MLQFCWKFESYYHMCPVHLILLWGKLSPFKFWFTIFPYSLNGYIASWCSTVRVRTNRLYHQLFSEIDGIWVVLALSSCELTLLENFTSDSCENSIINFTIRQLRALIYPLISWRNAHFFMRHSWYSLQPTRRQINPPPEITSIRTT